MYNFYKKTNQHRILIPLMSLNEKQKESIVSLLFVLAGCDQDVTEGLTDQEIEYIDFHTRFFKLENEFTLLPAIGEEGITKLLKDLPINQKRSLVIVFYGLLVSDSEASGFEILTANQLLCDLGISSIEIIETLINKPI